MKAKYLYEWRLKRRLKKKLAKKQRRWNVKVFAEKKLLNPCAICGAREAVTRDHLPPKAIFPKPRPNNLITVPACGKCNNGSSEYDDLFKVYLSMQAAEKSELGTKLFAEKTTRTLQRNQSLLNTIREQSTELISTDENGNIVTQTGVLWNSKAHDAVVERITRGLYFHHTGKCVPKGSKVKVYWFHEVPEGIDPNNPAFTNNTIGEEQFNYKFIIDPKNSNYAIWLFEFYGVHWAGGFIEPGP